MRPYAASVCGLKLLMYAPLSYCHDSRLALLGLEASDMRAEHRRREKVPNALVYVFSGTKIQVPDAAGC